MQKESIHVSSIYKEVYSRLRRQIASGKITPGERISLRQIAEAFGVSTMPVREALRRLQAEGFVHFERRSVRARQLSVHEVEEIFSIRLRLETLAIELAIPKILPEDIDKLRSVLEQMDRADLDPLDWVKLNREFHLGLYERSESRHLIQLIRNTWDIVEPYMCIYISAIDSIRFSREQHHTMLDLIQQGNLESLLPLTVEHLQSTCSSIMEELSR